MAQHDANGGELLVSPSGARAGTPAGGAPASPGDTAASTHEQELQDAALLHAHLEGDRDAFAELLRRHRRSLFRTVYGVVGHYQDTEDVLQETFTRAVRHAGSVRRETQVALWMRRIAVNTAIRHLERQRRVAVPVGIDSGPFDAGQPPAAADVEQALSVEKALGLLSRDQRACILLVDMRGFTNAAAAELLGIPVGTVKSRVLRARDALAQQLGDFL
ncbi:RNA polymerase sigma factor [Actinomycetospora termitidis]|uniref:Sigma-70 family RNA polymerase sigma factor n=1 Tax=Actinomycetospora termitidis TaxID=3053470 RepID=A0ABT7MIG4_9PSEU|nr:sigma-70 family RNA polymerase sigma factor [Actinomycetospora sp. Odt1-22]MDL5160473.1 sigma-70 family RNA polymerase sigma factor [Actinomycetospora sp. Odt1-22]